MTIVMVVLGRSWLGLLLEKDLSWHVLNLDEGSHTVVWIALSPLLNVLMRHETGGSGCEGCGSRAWVRLALALSLIHI